MTNTELNKEIIDILDNVIYWETCPKNYKVRIEAIKKQLTLTDVSQRSKLLPEFLMHDLDGKIITSVIGSADVTKEWNEYLVNCG